MNSSFSRRKYSWGKSSAYSISMGGLLHERQCPSFNMLARVTRNPSIERTLGCVS
jgi:hypothetical protein